MSRLLVAVALFGLVALAAADHHHGNDTQKEWTGKAWLGKWISTDRAENWDAFVAALGLPLDQYGGNHKTVHKLWKEGDHYHHQIIIKDKSYKQDVEFKLGEEGTTSHNNTEIKYLYTEDGNKLVNEVKIASKNKTIHDIYDVTGDDLEKTYKVNDVQAKRWYKKHTAQTPAA